MYKDGLDQLIFCSATWIIHRRALVLVLTFVFILMAGAGLRDLEFVNDYRIYFSEDDAQLRAFEALEDTYVEHNNVLIVVSSNVEQQDVFSREHLKAIAELTAAAWTLPFAYRVDSISNFQFTHTDQDDLIVEALFSDPENLTDEEIIRRVDVALGEPRLLNKLISPDASTTGIAVEFQINDEGVKNKALAVIPAVRQKLDEFSDQYPALSFRLTGALALDMAFEEAATQDVMQLIPLMFVVIITLIMLLLRSVIATVAIVMLIAFSAITALGVAGWLGIKLSPSSISAPMMIMTLAVADAVHIFSVMFLSMKMGHTQNQALIDSLKANFTPVFLTSLTTAVGFLTLNFSDIPPFRDLGNITAIGILVAFVLSITFLPAFVSLFVLKTRKSSSKRMIDPLAVIADFVINRRRAILWVLIPLNLAILAWIPKNEINNEFIRYFDPAIEFRQHTDYTMQNLTGIYSMEYSVPASGSNGIADPNFLLKLDGFAAWLRDQPEVVHVRAISDTFKQLNRNMHGDDPSWFRLPDERELAAQYLLFYELSLPLGLDLNNEINIDKSATRLVVSLGNLTTKEILAIAARSEEWLMEHAPEMFAKPTGPVVMFSDAFTRSIRSMILGSVVSIVVISIILILALRSFKHGILSLVPNLLPAALALGVWGLFVGQINMGVSMVMTMTLGIVVDDTIHFLSKYLRARRNQQYDTFQAVRFAIQSVGGAMFITTVALVIGFIILGQSLFGLNAQSAQVTAIAIFIALLTDLLLLPPLLMMLDNKKSV